MSSLLEPIDADQPCGPDLEYDPEFQSFQRMAQRQMKKARDKDEMVEVEPSWQSVQEKARALLGKSKDIRIVLNLCEASLKLEGLPGFARDFQALSVLLDTFWASIHPKLDVEDNDDPTERMNALLSLTDKDGFLKSLRFQPLVTSPLRGAVTLRQHYLIEGSAHPKGDEKVTDRSYIEAAIHEAIKDKDDKKKADIDRDVGTPLQLIRDARNAIGNKIAAELGDSFVPRFDAFDRDLDAIAELFKNFFEQQSSEPDTELGGESGGEALAGPIRECRDVIRAIDTICDYYEKHESSSPVPLLLQRAKRLAVMNYMEIVEDLTPDALAHAKLIVGVKDAEG